MYFLPLESVFFAGADGLVESFAGAADVVVAATAAAGAIAGAVWSASVGLASEPLAAGAVEDEEDAPVFASVLFVSSVFNAPALSFLFQSQHRQKRSLSLRFCPRRTSYRRRISCPKHSDNKSRLLRDQIFSVRFV